MKFFLRKFWRQSIRTAYHLTCIILPSFHSNYRDSAQTCPRRARFFARTLENEEPLTGAHIPTCRLWGWFSMDSREGARTVSAQRKGKEKCFTRRSNGADLFLTETSWLGAIEVFNDELFEVSKAVVRIVWMGDRYRGWFVTWKILLNRRCELHVRVKSFKYFSQYCFQCGKYSIIARNCQTSAIPITVDYTLMNMWIKEERVYRFQWYDKNVNKSPEIIHYAANLRRADSRKFDASRYSDSSCKSPWIMTDCD